MRNHNVYTLTNGVVSNATNNIKMFIKIYK